MAATGKPFLRGNQLWKLRTEIGRDRLFKDGATLWGEAILYFDWCDRNPWLRAELVKFQGEADQYDVPVGRPYTMDGLCVYLGVSGSYFRTAKGELREKIEKGKATPEEVAVLEVIEQIELTVRTQQIEGASVGVFNANLITRINGIADNINNNNTGDAVLRVTVRDAATAANLDKLETLL